MQKALQTALRLCIIKKGDCFVFELFDHDPSNILFEWDENKDAINFVKHGIRFKTAAKVFFDPNKLIREDSSHSKEVRFNVLGRAGKILFVVCAFRQDSVIRIISARVATASEARRYRYGENFDE